MTALTEERKQQIINEEYPRDIPTPADLLADESHRDDV